MERYSRRNHGARRHHRVAKKEVEFSPQKSYVIPKKYKNQLLAGIAGIIVLEIIFWFFIGFLVGRKTA